MYTIKERLNILKRCMVEDIHADHRYLASNGWFRDSSPGSPWHKRPWYNPKAGIYVKSLALMQFTNRSGPYTPWPHGEPN